MYKLYQKVGRAFDYEVHFDHPRQSFYPMRVAFGQECFQALTERYVPIEKARGYRFETNEGPVIATYDPVMVGKGKMNLMPLVVWDVMRAMEQVGKPAPEYPCSELVLYPTVDEFRQWCTESKDTSWLVHDIETPFSRKAAEDEEVDPSFEILRFSLARDDFNSITCPHTPPYVEVLKEFLAGTDCDRIGFNSREFDDPREKYNGWPMRGRRIDLRWLHHFLQPHLPQSLACCGSLYLDPLIPEWKSIADEEEQLYSALDAWATAKVFVGVKRALEKRRL